MNLIIITSLVFTSLNSAYGYNFGFPGANGRDGFPGQSGRSGLTTELVATGQSQILNLDGQDGMPGQSGTEGEDAYGCQMPWQVRQDLFGANGGWGGDGGNGGNGGNAGDLTVYYDAANRSINDLRALSVSQIPGRGAPAGYGENGGFGCQCTINNWIVRDCRTVSVPRQICDGVGNARRCRTEYRNEVQCFDQIYYCNSGQHGRPGRHGVTGTPGKSGLIRLIPQLTPVPADNTIEERLLTDLNRPLELVESTWSKHFGANSLFAPGSRVTDEYLKYESTLRKQVRFIWNGSRPVSEFSEHSLSVQLDQGKFSVTYDQTKLWLVYEIQEDATDVLVRINGAIDFAKDVKSLTVKGLRGRENKAGLLIQDTSSRADEIQTQYHLRVEGKKWFGTPYKILFEGTVPAGAIKQNGNLTLVSFKALGIDNKFLKKGKNIQITLRAERRWNGLAQTFKWNETKYDIP